MPFGADEANAYVVGARHNERSIAERPRRQLRNVPAELTECKVAARVDGLPLDYSAITVPLIKTTYTLINSATESRPGRFHLPN